MSRHILMVKICRFAEEGITAGTTARSDVVYLLSNQGYTVAAKGSLRRGRSGRRILLLVRGVL
jgi:hypothetical protein